MITATETRCWIAVDADGKPAWHGEHETHTATREQALEDITRNYGGRTDLAPAQLDRPCFVAVAACGSVYDEDGEGIEHWPSAEELADLLRSIDYTIGADGTVRCPDFCDCDCRAAPTGGVEG